jgi:hypothetical protein
MIDKLEQVITTLERHMNLAEENHDVQGQLAYCKCINATRSVLFELQQLEDNIETLEPA